MVLILSGIECMTIRFPLQPLTAYFVVQCHKIYFVVVSELLLRNNSKLIVAAFFLVDNEISPSNARTRFAQRSGCYAVSEVCDVVTT